MLSIWYKKYKNYPKEYSDAKQCINYFLSATCGKKIYLYGTGTVARNLVDVFSRLDISINGIFDKNFHLGNFNFSLPVLQPSQMASILDADSILIISINNKLFDSVINELSQYQLSCKYYQGETLHSNLRASLCLCDAAEGRSLDLRKCYECTILDNTCNSLQKYLRMVKNYNYSGTELSNMNMIGYTLGTICTLRCQHCCEAVPYLPQNQRYFVNSKIVLNDINKISSACKFITLVEFIGGEPFLHPDLCDIIKNVLKINNIGIIHIFTNSTVPPSDDLCNVIHDERISVYVSNYQTILQHKFQEKINQTLEKLSSFNISFFRGKKFDWRDFSSFELVNNYNSKELAYKYSNCFLSHCHRLSEGKLYHCPHQYACIKMSKFTAENILSIHDFSTEALAHLLDKFEEIPSLTACKYCTMPFEAESVPSGKQL